MDFLVSKDKDGNKITGYHVRLKGITEEGLIHEAKKYITKGDPKGYFGLYSKLAEGEQIDINLMPFDEENNKQKVMFEYKNGSVFTKKEFIRKVKF